MAIQINKQLNTIEGFAVPSGTHMKFITEFKMDGAKAEVALKPFVNAAAYNAGNNPFECKELRAIGNIMIDLTTLSESEQALLDQVSDIIHAKVIAAIAASEAAKAAQVDAEIAAEAAKAEQVNAEIEQEAAKAAADENYTPRVIEPYAPRVIEPYSPITTSDMEIV